MILRALCVGLLFTTLQLLNSRLQAQDSLFSGLPVFTNNFPEDLDSVKVDSFFNRLSIDLSATANPELYYEIFRWYRTCYHYGGNTNKGIDCSHFVNMLYEKIYGDKLDGNSTAMYGQCRHDCRRCLFEMGCGAVHIIRF